MWANFSSLLRRGSLWEVLNAIASGRVCGERWEEKKDIQHILSFPSPQPPNYQPTVEAARKRSLRRREQFQEEATKLDNYIILRGFHISLNWFSSWSNCLVFAGEVLLVNTGILKFLFSLFPTYSATVCVCVLFDFNSLLIQLSLHLSSVFPLEEMSKSSPNCFSWSSVPF